MIFRRKKKNTDIKPDLGENLKEELQAVEEEKNKDEKGLFSSIKKGLSKTREILTTDIEDLFTGNTLNISHLEDLEEKLISADIGVETTMELIDLIEEHSSEIKSPKQLKAFIKEKLSSFIVQAEEEEEISPRVILVTGVNGVGKTTTIGKLAHKFTSQGKSVLVGAADTFRAAAVEQLGEWAKRSGSDFVKHKEKTDPAAVVFDSIDAGIAREKDVIIIDTAGRLQNKENLMKELEKIKRTASKRLPEAPHEVLLVVDATTGQNAVSQAKAFNDVVGITGLIITKMDGTAKGGIAVSLQKEFKFPVKYIGVGEQMDDLKEFDPHSFLDAILD